MAVLIMLFQSYCPGKMTGLHWTAFAGILALNAVVPSPAELVARPFKIPTNSMRPTLRGGSNHVDHLIVDRLTYRLSSPRRGDLVVFRTDGIADTPGGQFWVKRLVGMPGERLKIRAGSIYANGTRLTTKDGIPPIHFATREAIERGDTAFAASYDVAKSTYFLLGDNSTNSLDSRYFGCIPQENVYGKVTGIYYPFSRAGRLRLGSESDGSANRSQLVRAEANQTSAAAGFRR
jgi:signal peptidase I